MPDTTYSIALRPHHGHPRYRLRLVAIASAAVGLILVLCTLVVALRAQSAMKDARLLTGLAMIPLSISLPWHLFDLFYKGLTGSQRSTPWALVVVMDTVDFFLFLVLMIANNIVINKIRGDGHFAETGMVMLLLYNQFPWMVCCAIHAIFVFQQLPLKASPNLCDHCQRKIHPPSTNTSWFTGNHYSALTAQPDLEDHADAEANRDATSPTNDHSIFV